MQPTKSELVAALKVRSRPSEAKKRADRIKDAGQGAVLPPSDVDQSGSLARRLHAVPTQSPQNFDDFAEVWGFESKMRHWAAFIDACHIRGGW